MVSFDRTLYAIVSILAVGDDVAIASSGVTEIVTAEEVEFIPLNPLRGDLSPRSGKLWGNIREDESAGSLVTFVDGFQSPPHIHNITYRAVVISGEIHNDDPDAAEFWMEPGSFWTQPAGEVHITAAQGKDPTIFLEILSGPYLVQPADEAFDTGERPINVAAQNIMWLSSHDSTRIDGLGAEMAYLWGSVDGNERNGTFLKLAPDYKGTLSTSAPLLRAVTIQGQTTILDASEDELKELGPGGYFHSRGEVTQELSCASDVSCILYLHTEGSYELTKS